ncbi:hypothetical protein D3C72_1961950 [compost metagenome]
MLRESIGIFTLLQRKMFQLSSSHAYFLRGRPVIYERIASTGSNFDAEYAGQKPDIVPIANETPTPSNILFKKRIIVNPRAPVIKVPMYTSKIPNPPPSKHKATASNRNCKRIK